MYAIAIDLGTTTLAASLIDLETGKRVAMAGSMNPQRRYGFDVVSRLDRSVKSDDMLVEMSALVCTELFRLAEQVCKKGAVLLGDVKNIAIAGNPAMQHILLKLPVKSLAFPPYRPLSTAGTFVKAAELDWDLDTDVYVFPMPGGFVGGDTVAFIYGAQPEEGELCLDMGTNGEMAILSGGNIWATSAAAGPAFEGGNLSCGMAALPGAISSIKISDEQIQLSKIGTAPAVGVCGSAVIELVSELLHNNILEPGGRLRSAAEIPSNLANRIIDKDGQTAFVFYRDARVTLSLTQGDIRQIQLAKGAIRAGMDVLFKRSAVASDALKGLLLTGSFGAVLQPEWLKSIGVFDTGMVQISRFTPEGAVAGVEKALMAQDNFKAVQLFSEKFRVVPLSGTPLFESMFLKHIDFPSE